jgi:predicted nucleic acid-binding protein
VTDHLIDNSVWTRLTTGGSGVTARLRRIERAPDESLVLDIQSALWGSGLVRPAGAVGILIAGYTIANDATVLTADHDFDHICGVSNR